MFPRVCFSLLLLLFCFSCNNSDTAPKREDPIDVGRAFINASLKGNYDEAKKYLLPDSVNLMYLENMQRFYSRMQDDKKQGYKEANIIINTTEPVTDTVTIINYSNTYNREPAKIKVVRIAKEWWVDFKYTFSGNM
jgi:hypothetical protein